MINLQDKDINELINNPELNKDTPSKAIPKIQIVGETIDDQKKDSSMNEHVYLKHPIDLYKPTYLDKDQSSTPRLFNIIYMGKRDLKMFIKDNSLFILDKDFLENEW